MTTRNLRSTAVLFAACLLSITMAQPPEAAAAEPFFKLEGPFVVADGCPEPTSTITCGAASVLIDFDHNGSLDIVWAFTETRDHTPSHLRAFRNNGNGRFRKNTGPVFARHRIPVWIIRDHAVADFNGDGLSDLIIFDHGEDHGCPCPGGQSRLLLQRPTGGLEDVTATNLPQLERFTHSGSVGDIDGDGDVDIFMGNWGPPVADPSFYLNDGSGRFREVRVLNLEMTGGSLLVDVDRDSDLDLILSGETEDFLLINDGSGNFTRAPANALPADPPGETRDFWNLRSADFNNDGWPDLVMTDFRVNVSPGSDEDVRLSIWLNRRDGTYRRGPRIPKRWTRENVDWALPADMNGDRKIDLVVAVGPRDGRLLINKGRGVFVNASRFLPRGWGHSLSFLPGDLDDDGDIDILSTEGQTYQVYRNMRPLKLRHLR